MKRPNDDFRDELREIITEAGLSRQQAATLMRVSIHTLNAYLKPRDNRSAKAAPLGAVELLAFKVGRSLPEVQEDSSEGSAST